MVEREELSHHQTGATSTTIQRVVSARGVEIAEYAILVCDKLFAALLLLIVLTRLRAVGRLVYGLDLLTNVSCGQPVRSGQVM